MRFHAALAAVILAGCGGGSEPRPEPKAMAKAEPRAEPKAEARPELMPAKIADPEPEHVLVAHVLVAFDGAARSKATRSKEAAEKLAYEMLARARKGEDFNKLIKDFSDDSGPGVYGMANHRISPFGDEYERRKMAAAFGDVGFKLEVGSIGMSVYDPQKSPFGWHIIKRLK